MANKVVYNNCYGGFSISSEAVRLARKLSNNPAWGGCTLAGEHYSDGVLCTYDYDHHPDVQRHDATFVQVVEQLGEAASGRSSTLAIALVEGNQYRVEEYDGSESVVTPEQVGWITI